MGIVVICSYKPNEGGEAAFLELLKRHHPVLSAEGLITDRAVTFFKSDDGAYLEIFEWVSEEASRGAHDREAVKEIWGDMAEVCAFVPLASVEQTQTPFAHFAPFEF